MPKRARTPDQQTPSRSAAHTCAPCLGQLVNDLASVNVDAGTVRRASAQEDGVETIELQNGCVCCGAGASAELAPILRRLSGQGFDHLVVELSGVADPASVKANLLALTLTLTLTLSLTRPASRRIC